VQIKFTTRGSRDFAGYYNTFTDQLKKAFGADGLEIGPKVPLAGGGGSFVIRTDKGQRVSVTLFVPAKDKSDKAYHCLASASGERWKTLGPLFEAIVMHWYDHAGNALAADYRFDKNVIAAPSAGTEPATTRGR
jgi:hypothetical protein